MRGWIEVSEERLARNFGSIARAAGAETEVLAVVKANAYGHGAEVCSVALARAGARWFGVTSAAEGVRVRAALDQAGFDSDGGLTAPKILVLCGLMPEEVELIGRYSLSVVIWNTDQVAWLSHLAGADVHVEVDTGMGRQGVLPGAALDALLVQSQDAGLHLEGVMTHFCSAEEADSELTQTQERRFEAAITQVRGRGLKPMVVHAGNSSTIDNPAQGWPWLVELAKSVGARAMVRSGLALYGYCLPIASETGSAEAEVRPGLQPVLTWKTRVLAVSELAAGQTVGYGAAFVAAGPMRVAVLPVGYGDGLRRELSSTTTVPGGWVMVRGQRAAIVGRISMNLAVVDVTGVDVPGLGEVSAGDEVVLLGEGVTADDHARLAETIPYEILCGIRVHPPSPVLRS